MREECVRVSKVMGVVAVWSASVMMGGAQGGQPEGEPTPWIHIDVAGGTGNMNLDLPLAVIEAALAMAPGTIVSDGQLQLGGDQEIPLAAIRTIWHQLRDAGDIEFGPLQFEGQDVQIVREGESVLLTVNAGDVEAEMRVEVPVVVLDALLSGEGELLNVRAAIEALSPLRGEVVRVMGAGNNIRVWIDESPSR